METHMYIDQREKNIITFFQENQKKDKIYTQNLDIGDIQFVIIKNPSTQEKQEKRMIIERKSVKDLAASIKDGRYNEQKQRLFSYKENNPDTILSYIIEGHFSFHPQFTCANMNSKILSSAIINSMIRDKIMFWFVPHENETKYLLEALFTRFSQEPLKYFSFSSFDNIVDTQGDYVKAIVNNVQCKKKDNINPRLCLIMQLSCIPGFSSSKGKDIVDTLEINTIGEFTEKIKENPVLLTKIKGIGPKLQENLRTYLF